MHYLKAISSVLLLTIAFVPMSGCQVDLADAQKVPVIKEGDPLPANLFVELAKKVNPAVVNIYTSTQMSSSGQVPPRFQNDPFFQFFRPFMEPQMNRPRQSLGTGFIIRKDGLIITNAHVIDKADVIKVQLDEKDKTQYEAEVIGKDIRTDVALIKINVKKALPVAELGSSGDLQVGEWVAAFGNPYGHGHTVTKGIVSAKGREIDELNQFSFIQTDASINPGNSGGPLVNTRGQVVGVNTAIDARANGIGFAIPIDDVKSILPALEKDGQIRRGFLGVYLTDIGPQEAKSLNLKDNEGALITQTMEGSPAEKAGIKPYDLIKEVDGKEVASSRDLMRHIQDTRVGQEVKVKLIRQGSTKSLNVTVGPHPDEKNLQAKTETKTYEGQKAPYDLGFKMKDYSASLQKALGLPKLRRPHPVVIDVTPNSPASKRGLSRGDIILDVNTKPVESVKSLLRRLNSEKNRGMFAFRVLRGNSVAMIYLPLKDNE